MSSSETSSESLLGEKGRSSTLASVERGGWLTLLGGMCIHLVIGNMYLWGNTGLYIISYFHYLGDKEATNRQIITVIPVSFLIQSFFNPVGAYLQKRYDIKVILLVGQTVCVASIYCAFLAKTWHTFMMFYAGTFPVGVGIIYWPAVMCAWEWFEHKKGFATGMIIGSFGFGAFLFGILAI